MRNSLATPISLASLKGAQECDLQFRDTWGGSYCERQVQRGEKKLLDTGALYVVIKTGFRECDVSLEKTKNIVTRHTDVHERDVVDSAFWQEEQLVHMLLVKKKNVGMKYWWIIKSVKLNWIRKITVVSWRVFWYSRSRFEYAKKKNQHSSISWKLIMNTRADCKQPNSWERGTVLTIAIFITFLRK